MPPILVCRRGQEFHTKDEAARERPTCPLCGQWLGIVAIALAFVFCGCEQPNSRVADSAPDVPRTSESENSSEQSRPAVASAEQSSKDLRPKRGKSPAGEKAPATAAEVVSEGTQTQFVGSTDAKPQGPVREFLSHHQALSFLSGDEELLFDVTTNDPIALVPGESYRFSITLLKALIKFGRVRNSPESDAQLAARSKLDLANTVFRSSIDGITGEFSLPATNADDPKLGWPFYVDVYVSEGCAAGPAMLEVVIPTYFVETEDRLYLKIKVQAQISPG